jgi:hypothetical protein
MKPDRRELSAVRSAFEIVAREYLESLDERPVLSPRAA